MKNMIEVKWAFIFIMMTFLWMLLEKATGLHDVNIEKHPIYTNFIAIPAIAIYVFALLDKRKNYYEGYMSYKQGVITGLIITFIVTLLTPLSQYIILTFITPDFFTNAINFAVENKKMTLIEAQEFFSLKNYIFQSLIGAPVMGILTTLIVSITTKKLK
ncbi:MAG: DUF4199 domain-containing protein [Raineya sp.]|jgi:hypothetical protein|nr:DUF4199 domain-containing protein [Raineya sp.]